MKNILRNSNFYKDWMDSSDVTTGSSGEIRVFPIRGESDPVKKARDVIPQIKNKTIAKQLDNILLTIHMMVQIAQQERPDIINIPPLLAHIGEDGAVTVEWIFPDFRVGFNIEPNPDDSGWHLVSNKKLNELNASGQLKDIDALIYRLLKFILGNI